MTGSPARLADRRATGTDERTAHSNHTHAGADWIFSAAHIVGRTAPASRPLRPLTRSRSARALTPTPTPACPPGREEAPTPVTNPLDSPRSFRNDKLGAVAQQAEPAEGGPNRAQRDVPAADACAFTLGTDAVLAVRLASSPQLDGSSHDGALARSPGVPPAVGEMEPRPGCR
jgi:hypothetical protein